MKTILNRKSRQYRHKARASLTPGFETLETRVQSGSLFTHYFGMSPLLAIGSGLNPGELYAGPLDGAHETGSAETVRVAGPARPTNEPDRLAHHGAARAGADDASASSMSRGKRAPRPADRSPLGRTSEPSNLTKDLWGAVFGSFNVGSGHGLAGSAPAADASKAGMGSSSSGSGGSSGGAADHSGGAGGGASSSNADLPDPGLGTPSANARVAAAVSDATASESSLSSSPPTPTASSATPITANQPTVVTNSNPPPVTAAASAQKQIGFGQGLEGWTVSVSGGSAEGKGSVRPGSAVLSEGDSFLVDLQQSFVVPANPAPLTFAYADLQLDTSDPQSINDAFEASLVDAAGRNLVHPFAPGRDAFFNVSEEAGAAFGPGVSETGTGTRTVTVDLSSVPAGTEATLRFRLVNNDRDVGSTVRILEVRVPTAAEPPRLEPVADQTGLEGTPLVIATSFTDPDAGDSHRAVVDWGDGTTSPASIEGANGIATVSASHTYADNGSYAATLTVTDGTGQAASDAFLVMVGNVAAVVQADLAFEAADGADGPELVVVLTGEFSDPGFDAPAAGTSESFVIQIDWGDGSPEVVDAAVVQGSPGVPTLGRFTARHSYAQAGMYTATVTVTDDDGGVVSVSQTHGVARIDVAPAINLKSNGVIPVKVFSGLGFDAAQVDAASLRFGPGGASEDHGEIHGGGSDHVMTHFRAQASGIRPTDTVAFLSGRLADGTPFVGMDSIRIVHAGDETAPTSPSGGTKFFVVDPNADRAFRYAPDGAATGSFALDGVAANARGVASNAAGDRVWVIDGATHAVTVQGADGALLGSWRAEGLVRPEDLATEGTDIWVVDAGQHRVFRYLSGAGHTMGIALPTSSFALHADNGSPTGLATNGSVLWVTDDAADAVFVYDPAGTLLGRWQLDPANANPSGITGDPSGVSPDLWVVDRDSRAVYRYAAGTIHRGGSASAAGTFSLAATNTQPEGIADPPGGGSFTIGAVVAESIAAIDEVDVWTFQAAAGQRLFFDAQGGTNAVFMRWTLTDPSGVQLFTGSFADRGILVAPTDGEYSLTVSAISLAGSYQFQVFDVPEPIVTAINVDEVVSGAIAIPGEEDRYTFNGAAGQRLFFDVQQNGTSPSRLGFTLLRPDGTALFPRSTADRDVFSLAEAGTYTVVVNGFTTLGATGAYQFRLWEVPLPTTTPFQVGDVVSGTIAIPGAEDHHTFAGTAGQRLYFDKQENASFTLGFSLLRPDGSVLFPTSSLDIPTFTLAESGTYTVIAGDEDLPDAVGAYRFRVVEVAPVQSLPINFNELADGTIDTAGETDEYTFTGAAGQQLYFDVRIAGIISFSLHKPDGTVLFSHENRDQGVLSLPQSGTYTLVVGADSSEVTGPYQFGLIEVAAPGPSGHPDSKGTDFWLTFPGNHRGVLAPKVPELRLFVSAEEDTQVSVVIEGLDWATGVTVRAGAITTIELPSQADLGLLSDRFTGNGIHVTAAKEVTVYGLNYIPFTTDAYLALPVDVLGRDYYVLGYENSIPASLSGPTPSELALVGTADGTVVTITPSVKVGTRNAGVPYSITLDRGQTYQLLAFGLHEDLSGTRISSTEPVAVFGGSMIANVPFGFTTGDHLVEQLPPLETWGKQFYTAPLATRLGGDTFRFLAAEDGTTVRVNGSVVATLDRGQRHERIIEGPASIEADKPILVAQYAHGSSYDGTVSDPLMALVTPSEQFLAGYTVSTPATGFAVNYVNLVAPEAAVGQITLNGSPVAAALFQPIGQSGFFAAQVAVGIGTANLSGPLSFGVMVYGFNTDESYGYPGGMSLAPINAVSGVALTPEAASLSIGQLHQAVATVTDAGGQPLRGVRVDFSVAGANESLGFAFTDESGQAFFSYVGAAVGTDTLTASAGGVVDSARIDWTAPVPTLVVTQPLDGSTFDAGTPVVVSGVALAARPPLAGSAVFPNQIVQVTINGTPVEALDAAGQFFGQATILPGRNVFTITATDALGQTASQEIVVTGIQRLANQPAFDLLSDVTASFAPRYARTSYQQQSRLLYADWVIDNAGQYAADAPLFVGVTNISDPRVQVREHSGITPDGIPYYDFSDAVPGGTLAPGQATLAQTVVFSNPEQVRFTYELVFFGLLNRAPEVVSVPKIEALAGRPYAYDVSVLDADGGELGFRLLTGPAGMTLDPATGMLRWSPQTADIGAHSVALQVSDGRGGIGEQRFVLSAIEPPPNRPPVFTSPPVVHAAVNEDYSYLPGARDFDGDELTFSLLGGPAGLTVAADTGHVEWRPSAGQAGTHLVVLQVSDGQGGTATQQYIIDVQQDPGAPANHPPVITSMPPAGPLGVGLPFVYDVQAQDADGDSLIFQLAGALPGMEVDPDTGRFRWTPAADQAGQHEVDVVVSDGRGGEDRRRLSFSVEVNPANDAPVIRSSSRTQTGLVLPYAYLVDAFDPSGDPLSFTLTTAPAGMSVDADGLITWQPTPDQVGTHAVTLRVSDGRGGAAQQSFDVTVDTTLVDSAPVITSTPLLSAVVGDAYRLDMTAVDPDGDPILWRLVEGPRGMALGLQTGVLTWLPAADQVGQHTVVVRAEDPFSAADIQTFTVTVSALNRPPLITSAARTAAGVGRPYAYAVSAADAERDRLHFSLPVAPAGMSVDDTGLIRWTPTDDQAGLHAVTVLAEDGQGNGVAQTFFVNVAVLPANQAPVITGTPRLTAVAGLLYTAAIRGIDPDGYPLAFGFSGAAPEGMTLDSGTGLIEWTPAEQQVGDHAVIVTATDPDGGVASVAFTIRVAANLPPTIASGAPAEVSGGAVYRYDVRANDPEGGRLSYALSAGPAGMTIDAMGRLRWTTTPADVGAHPVALTVTDEFGLKAPHDFTVTVTPDTEAPRVHLVATLGAVDLGAVVMLRVLASDNVAVTDLTLTIAGVLLALDPNGAAIVTADQAGLFNIVAGAADAAGNQGQDAQPLRVIDPRDQQAPHVTIASPAAGALLTTLTDIVGTVDDPEDQLAFYQVYYARADHVDTARVEWDDVQNRLKDADYVLLAEGNSEVSNARLATFDPTMRMNDAYVIVVAAFDLHGSGWVETVPVDLTGGLKLGEFSMRISDLSIPLAGIPIQVTRVYDTRQSSESADFGFGWTLDVQEANIRETVAQTPAAFFSSGAPFRSGTRVYLTNPAGQRVGFTFDPVQSGNPFLGQLWTPRFTADAGVYERLEVAPLALKQRTDGTFVAALLGFPYNPDDYRLLTPEGIAYHYGQQNGLEKITDLNGNTITFNADGIFSATGEAVLFQRDPQGRIDKIIDPDGGEITYGYDFRGDLVTVANQEGHTTTQTYRTDRPHYLEQVIDALGCCPVMTEYGPGGELVATMDAVGGRTEQHFDVPGFTGEIRDRRGNVTKLVYNERGNVTRAEDAEGNVTLYEYADPRNPDRETAITNPRGFVTRYTYDESGNVLTETTDVGVTSYTYTALNKLETVTDPLRNVTTNEYDARGNLTAIINALGDRREFTYDDRGRQTTATDFRGNVTTAVYPAGSSQPFPSQVINPDGSTRSFTFNAYGQPASVIDEEGNTSAAQYDGLGRMIREVDGEGKVTQYVYVGDRLDHRISPDGNVTRYEYDDANRLTARVDAEGGRIEFTYNANDYLTQFQDPLGNVTFYVYDKADRVVEEIDPLGRSSLFAYDGAGNLTEIIDRNGGRRTFDFDALNRQTAETWWVAGAPAYHATYQYDAANNLIQASDPYSNYVFSFDALNRPKTVDNAGTPNVPHVVLAYDYDEDDRPISVSDNAGVRVDSIYDQRGFLAQRAWQGGGIDPARVDFAHRADGALRQVQRFADLAASNRVGQSTYGYDRRGLVDSMIHQGAADVVFSNYDYDYTDDGWVSRLTLNGAVTDYTYDGLGQLTGAAYGGVQPDESYAYDANGNRTAASGPAGAMTYVIGAANRVLTDGLYDYDYDDAGNLVGKTETATAIRTSFAYDHRGRLTSVVERSAGGIILSEVEYEYDVFDRRIAAVVNGVRTVTVYDDDAPWADYDAAGNVVARYLAGDQVDDLLARWRPGEGTAWYLTDRLGSVRELMNADGVLLNRIDFTSFGEIVRQTNPAAADRFAFAGREFDVAARLYYNRARFYDPGAGRFVSEDPIRFSAGDANLYRYVTNSPTNATDPTGLVTSTEYAALVRTVCLVSGVLLTEITLFAAIAGAFTDVPTFEAVAYVDAVLTLICITASALKGLFPKPPRGFSPNPPIRPDKIKPKPKPRPINRPLEDILKSRKPRGRGGR